MTHSHRRKKEETSSATTGTSENQLVDTTSLHQVWTLRLEGKLLIGNLDHVSAEAHDQRVGYVAPNDDLDRSKGEKEEEEVVPVRFTNFFEKVEVEFQTLYSPRPHPMAKKKATPSKKRRSAGTKQQSSSFSDETTVDPRLTVTSPTVSLTRTKAVGDAHVFDFHYESPPPIESRYQIDSVVAKVKLYSDQSAASKDPFYELSAELARSLFPNHVAAEKAESELADSMDSTKKRKVEDGNSAATSSPTIPIDNEVHMPDGLTMEQICTVFFMYIQDHNLCDESDRAIIVCDEKLQSLFGMEKFHFSGLQQILLAKNLITPLRQSPVKLVYIMKEETSTSYVPPPGKSDNEYEIFPSLFQFDMDVVVPALFPFRCREILRRLKRRELEYTSSRTKARYLLMARRAKDEEDVKAMIDQVVSGHLLSKEYIPVCTALAKAAPPHTEARMAANYDARLCYLMSMVQEHTSAALRAWNKVSAVLPSSPMATDS